MDQILPINSVMNKDDDPRFVRSSEGYVIDRVNMRPNSIDGKRFRNQKIKGNTLIATDKYTGLPITLPPGENKVIGWCKDYQRSAIIYFIYNSLEWHCILRYYHKDKKIEKVWWMRPSLDFEDSNIRAVVAGDMLYWVNGSKEPKSFVLHMAVNYTNDPLANLEDGTKYAGDQAPFETNVFPMIKRPPRWKPKAEYISNQGLSLDGLITVADVKFNNLRRRMFQFKYKYTYLDNQESAYSPTSKVPLPPEEISISGTWNEDIWTNNTIKVTVNSGSAYVSKITLAVRECQDRTAPGDWYTFHELEKYKSDGFKILDDNIEYEVYFMNTRLLENINTDINNRYFDDIPLSGNDILLLDGKYLVISMPVKNYDLEDLYFTVEAVETVIPDAALVSTTLPTSVYSAGHDYYVTANFYPDSLYVITFTDANNTPHSYSLDSSTLLIQNAPFLAHALATLVEADKANIFLFNACTASGSKITFDFALEMPKSFSAIVYIGGTEGQNVYKSLKRNQYHPFVIIYNDGFGRYNIAQGEKEMYSPKEKDCANSYQIQCKMTLYHKPPVWATSYRIGYIPNRSYTYSLYVPYVQVFSEGTHPISDVNDEYNTYSYTVPMGYYFLRINQSLARMRKNNQNLFISDYVFQEGDRLRVICPGTDYDNYEIDREYPLTLTKSGSDDAVTIGYLVKKNSIPLTISSGAITLLEIYRPNTGASSTAGSYNNIFFETGDEYEILGAGTDSRRHAGDTNQVLDVNDNPSTPAVITLDFGDVYVRGRMGVDLNYISVPTAILIEDLHYSDYFSSSGIDLGRVTAKIDSEQKELNSIVRGESYIEGSKINWLNVFLAQTPHFDASDMYGRIIAIEEMGGTLKVIQEHKEGSIMIGEVNMKQADAGDWILIGDSVFGAYRRYVEGRGSTYRRSVATNLRNVYYFDESTGEFIRSSPNGQLPLSKEYGMQNWFEKKAKALREYTGQKDVIVSFDNDYEEVLITFTMGTSNETLVFSEKEGFKGWTYFGTYYGETDIPENFATFEDTLVSFMNGQLYLHGSGNLNTFYGKIHACSIIVPVNQHAAIAKRFSSIKINSDKNIFNYEFNILEGTNYPAQKSTLVPSIIREKENVLYSDILRNIIKRNGTEDSSLLYDGTRMVGDYMNVTISDDSSEDVSLGSLQVNFLIAK